MERRNCLKVLLASAGLIVTGRTNGASMDVVEGQRPIELHLDLAVDPAKEQEMLHIFETAFRPAISGQPGFIEVKMLKLSSTLRGPAPPGCNYQFILTFASEEMRQQWVATSIHKALWPQIEATLTSPNYSRLLYEVY